MGTLRPLIAGNWKMNGLLAPGTDLARGVADWARANAPLAADVLVCPPFTLLAAVAQAAAGSGVMVGAQDCHAEVSGAHTGDVSARQVKDAGCTHVILGHSERRADHGETDPVVRAKTEAAYEAGLVAVVCVGETLAERESGRAFDVVRAQVRGSLPAAAAPANTVIAYEPVWAIGTGKVATAEQAQEIHAFIRSELSALLGAGPAREMRILYGGSMKPDNAGALLAQPDVNGGLIGGASLKAEDFTQIVSATR